MQEEIQKLEIDKELVLKKGLSGIDISKEIELENILIRKGFRGIGGFDKELPFEVEYKLGHPHVSAHKQIYATLGLLMFELLFSKQDYICCNLTHENAEIKQLFLYLDRDVEISAFLKVKEVMQYEYFEYFPIEIEGRYPNWSEEEELEFNYACSKIEDKNSQRFVEKADQLVIEMTVRGLLNLAELFLNISRIENKQTEICLENPLYGVGGVNKRSMEVSFWLPDGIGFFGEDLL